jgi:hypothetical protein
MIPDWFFQSVNIPLKLIERELHSLDSLVAVGAIINVNYKSM